MCYRIKVWWERWLWRNIYVVCQQKLRAHSVYMWPCIVLLKSQIVLIDKWKNQRSKDSIAIFQCIHIAMNYNYVKRCSPFLSNSSTRLNVSTTKATSFSYTTVCKTLIFTTIHNWTTVSSLQVAFRLICEEKLVSLSSFPNSRVMMS